MKNLRALAQKLGLKDEVDCYLSYRDVYGKEYDFDYIYVEDDLYDEFKENELVKSISSLTLKKKGFYFEGDGRWKEMVVFDKDGVEHGFIKDRGTNEDYIEFVKECRAMENRELDWQEADINDIQLTSVDKRD